MADQKQLVLIIEDDITLAKMYVEKLNIEGFKTLVAHDGDEGLKLALEKSPNVVLLDIMLPKRPGLELVQKLRENEKGKNMPIIALSNLTERTEADKAKALGVKEYLAKAMHTPEEIVEKVKKYAS